MYRGTCGKVRDQRVQGHHLPGLYGYTDLTQTGPMHHLRLPTLRAGVWIGRAAAPHLLPRSVAWRVASALQWP
jgi:hypothetical protein